MSLTDKQISDNFPLLVSHYLELNNLSDVAYSAEQKQGEQVVITVWGSNVVPAPTYNDMRNYCLDSINKKISSCNFISNSCPVMRNVVFKSLHKLFTETNNMNSTDTIEYLAGVSGLTIDDVTSIING